MQCQKIPGAEHGLFPDAKPKFNNFDMLKGGWVQEEKKKKKQTHRLQLIPGVAQQQEDQALDSFQALTVLSTGFPMFLL